LSKHITMKNMLLLVIPLAIIVSAYLMFMQKEESLPIMTEQDKKEQFKSLIQPPTQEVYADLMTQYEVVKKTIEEGATEDLEYLKVEYKAASNEELLMAMKPHPISSITLAQTAMESSWATSRFFREGYNIFGVWSFDEYEPRIAAGEKRGDKTIWVKEYSSVKAVIKDYYRTLARGRAFGEFRALRLKTSDTHQLVKKLNKYSEKGTKYATELSSIINFNKFQAYDK
jgi:Bax protein